MQSVIPNHVRVLTTTATATKTTLEVVQNKLFLQAPNVVSLPPEKANIVYEVLLSADLPSFKEIRCAYIKTLIFCRKYVDCSNLYLKIRQTIKENFTESPNMPNIHAFRIVDMFHSAGTKERVLNSFSALGGKLRIVIATTAFGLDVDVPDIHQIVHWGPPDSLDSYVQETGCGARDGSRCKAVLLYKPNKHTSKEI